MTVCGITKSRCACFLPPGHESPHLCACGGSYLGENVPDDSDVIELPSERDDFFEGREPPRWDGERWNFTTDREPLEMLMLLGGWWTT